MKNNKYLESEMIPMQIVKVASNEEIVRFIEMEQLKYEDKNGVSCNYTPFCYVAKIENEIIGAIKGASFFSEVRIDKLVVKEEYRGKGIGTKLINEVEKFAKFYGFNNMNICAYDFQSPEFYENYGFKLEYVRKNINNSRLNKYSYVKILNEPRW